MTAQFCYEIGPTAARVLFPRLPESMTGHHDRSPSDPTRDEFLGIFMARWSNRLTGEYRRYFCKFSVVVPYQIGAAMRFLRRVESVREAIAMMPSSGSTIFSVADNVTLSGNRSMISRTCNNLVWRMANDIGLPHYPFYLPHMKRPDYWSLEKHPRVRLTGMEAAFIKAIDANPDDLVSWMAYADWLADQGGAAAARGQYLQLNLARKDVS